MPRFSRARLNKEADHFEQQARRSDAAALSGDQDAKDPTLGPCTKNAAARAASNARSKAREFRHIAAELRTGEIPDNVQLD
ncbi:hypothetical protein Srufu_079850 (plasmid) [Streptomyces libani subsp. rufus]|nr:hypothetical protein Srufu_079850 [Streptomyces libani subsp. rufus]